MQQLFYNDKSTMEILTFFRSTSFHKGYMLFHWCATNL